MNMKYLFSLILIFFVIQITPSQTNEKIQWKTWTELEEAFTTKPKPVFIYFHAHWCNYCKKLKREVFTKKKVIEKINSDYYAVKMDVETLDTIVFDGVTFTNKQAESKRNGIHELPLLLASREDKLFTLPATLLFNRDFKIRERLFTYYTSKTILEKF